jgi:hypothetical protein
MQQLRTLFYAFLGTTIVSSVVSATTTIPPEPSLRKSPAAWIGFILMFLFFGIVITISLMTSKRGHQD